MSDILRRAVKVSHLLTNATYRKGLIAGVAATVENEPFLRAHKFSTYIDVGANKGQFALAALAANPTGRVISFEPVDTAIAAFKRVFSRDPRVTLHECALGEVDGSAIIRVPESSGSASMIVPLSGSIRDQEIRVRTLDGVLAESSFQEPALLKLDIQGFELQALRGGVRTLRRFSDLFVEVSFTSLAPEHATAQQIIEYLTPRGFVLAGVYNPINVATPWFAADMHFRRNSSDQIASLQ